MGRSVNVVLFRAGVAFSIVGGGAAAGLLATFFLSGLSGLPPLVATYAGCALMLGIFYFGTRAAVKAGI